MSPGIKPFHIPFNRRRLLKSMAAAAAGWTLPGYLAEALTFAPSVTQGPYYPRADDISLDVSYVDAPAERGFYKVSFRPPGVNTGTP